MAQAFKTVTNRQTRVHPKRFTGQSQMSDAQLFGAFNENAKNNGVRVQMMMAVDVVEWKADGAELFELRADLSPQLFPEGTPPKKILEANPYRIRIKFLIVIDKSRDFFRTKRRVATQEREVKTYA